jgi:hypothetical protein
VDEDDSEVPEPLRRESLPEPLRDKYDLLMAIACTLRGDEPLAKEIGKLFLAVREFNEGKMSEPELTLLFDHVMRLVHQRVI